ncbi:type II toxin-antitoxin system VapC family toxin [Dapis sp. BLCC M229]|uniref:type II toxin-antitoxin system VapC family toxin n=1 Tax=Dapis sp. BLCC M229 TaxID=3400188 RepID=UPI003CFBC152
MEGKQLSLFPNFEYQRDKNYQKKAKLGRYEKIQYELNHNNNDTYKKIIEIEEQPLWKKEWANIAKPLFTCEAVISEACFILKDVYSGKDAVIGLVTSSYFEVPFHFRDEVIIVRGLMKKYESVPMSFADACLVRMNELILGSSLLTLDSYFCIYRKNKTEIIDVIIPDKL